MAHGHPNDARADLRAHERPEEAHLRGKFGYWWMVETRMIRERLIAEGRDPKDPALDFDISREYMRRHAADETPQQGSARRAAKWAAEAEARWMSGEGTRSVAFTRPELLFLADHFDGANDPIAAAILAKVRAHL